MPWLTLTLRSLQATQAIEARLNVSDVDPTMSKLRGVCRLLAVRYY